MTDNAVISHASDSIWNTRIPMDWHRDQYIQVQIQVLVP